MKRNQYILGFLLTVGLLAGSILNAQPSGDLLLVGPPPPSGAPLLPSPGRLNLENWTGIRSPYYQEMTALTTLSGTVQQLTGNEEDVLDGFTLNTGSSTMAVHFPPHMGQGIHSVAKPGTQVNVIGFSETTPEGQTIFQLTQLTAGKSVIWETPPILSAVSATPTVTTVKGKIVAYQLDREGRATGLTMSDQTLVRVPPLLARQIISMIPKDSTISVDGYVQQPGKGHFMLHKHTILQASVLTINGQPYLIR